jgi:energy-coupling factor transporter ATP-binding protein EcfA2
VTAAERRGVDPWVVFQAAELAAAQEFDGEMFEPGKPIERREAPIGNHTKWDLLDLAKRKAVTAAWDALPDGGDYCPAVKDAIEGDYTKDGRPLTEFARLLRLARLAEQGHRGGRDATEAQVAMMRSKPYDQVRTIRDVLLHLSDRGLTAEGDKGCCAAPIAELDVLRRKDRTRTESSTESELLDDDPDLAATDKPRGHGPLGGDPVKAPPAGLNLPATFWESRPSLRHIRDAAWSGWACPDAVLGNLLARAGAYANPKDGVDLTGGDAASLSTFVIAYGPPGAGKTTAAKVAARLLPPSADLVAAGYREKPLGTGEGMITAFMAMRPDADDPDGKAKTLQQIRSNVLFTMDEGEALFRANSRTGTTVMQTLRSMWSGAIVGQANASVERDRQLDPGKYSTGMVLNFQPDTIGPLFDAQEVGGGTPHRFVFVSVTDPSAPDELPEWPGELRVTRPSTPGMVKDWGTPEPVTLTLDDAAVRREIQGRRREVLRGTLTLSEQETHTTLVRGRVAAILALWDGRTSITTADWQLAGDVIETSARVRDAAIAHGRRRTAAANRHADDQHAQRSAKAAVVTMLAVQDEQARRVERVAAVLARKVWVKGDLDGRGVKDAIASRDREVRDDAIAYAVEEKWVERVGTAGLRRGPAVPPDA